MKHFFVGLANGCRITSAYGDTPTDARRNAVEALNRPGRYDILRKWQADGMPLRDAETGRCTVQANVIGTVRSADIFQDGELQAAGQEYNVTKVTWINGKKAYVTDVLHDGERLVLVEGLTAVADTYEWFVTDPNWAGAWPPPRRGE